MLVSDVSAATPLQGATPQERIANGLARRGISIKEAAKRLGVRWQTVQYWTQPSPADRKPRLPQGQNLAGLAGLLGVTIDEILGVMSGQDPPFAAWREFLETKQGRALTPAQRRTLQAIVFADGEQPTVLTYQMIAASLATTEARS